MKKFFVSQDENPDQLLEMLCGEVFHVTTLESYNRIVETEAILNNKDGELFGLNNTGTHEKSYSIAKGYVSFFDLRNKHYEHDRKWIDKWLLNKYHIFSRPHFKTSEIDQKIQYDMVFLILKPDCYEQIISYDDVKKAEVDLLSKYHLMPYTECWIDDKVSIEQIKEVYEVHIEDRSMISSITHNMTDEELEKFGHRISELRKKL